MGSGASAASKYERTRSLSDVGEESAKAPTRDEGIPEPHKSDTQGSNSSLRLSSRGRFTDQRSKYSVEKFAEDVEMVESDVPCSHAMRAANDTNLLKKYADEKTSGNKKRATTFIFAPPPEEPLLYSPQCEQSHSSGDEEQSSLGNNKIGRLRLLRQSGEK